MYCKQCAVKLGDDEMKCPDCGAKRGRGKRFCAFCGEKQVDGQTECSHCHHPYNETVNTALPLKEKQKTNTAMEIDISKNPLLAAIARNAKAQEKREAVFVDYIQNGANTETDKEKEMSAQEVLSKEAKQPAPVSPCIKPQPIETGKKPIAEKPLQAPQEIKPVESAKERKPVEPPEEKEVMSPPAEEKTTSNAEMPVAKDAVEKAFPNAFRKTPAVMPEIPKKENGVPVRGIRSQKERSDNDFLVGCGIASILLCVLSVLMKAGIPIYYGLAFSFVLGLISVLGTKKHLGVAGMLSALCVAALYWLPLS